MLPLLALLLYLGALYLAKGWRREALIAAGGGILVATLFVLLAAAPDRQRSGLGGGLRDGQAGRHLRLGHPLRGASPAGAVRPRDRRGVHRRGRFWRGPGRHEVAVRRFLAPYLRDHPVAVYSVVAVLFLLWLSFIPGINNLGQVLVIVVLAALAVVGVEILRRQTAQEFPPGPINSRRTLRRDRGEPARVAGSLGSSAQTAPGVPSSSKMMRPWSM